MGQREVLTVHAFFRPVMRIHPCVHDEMTTNQFHHHSNLAHLLSQYLGKSLCNTSETFMTLKPFYTLLLNQTLYIHSEQATVFANSFQ